MEVIKNKTVVVRKMHRCHGCLQKIPCGSKVNYTATADGGKILGAYWCDTCCTVISDQDWWDDGNGIGEGELKDNYQEYYEDCGAKLGEDE